MKDNDVLIVARPDHSLLIYDALTQQDSISYFYLTFKVVPAWVKRLCLNSRRLYAVSKNSAISIRCTIVNILKFKFHFKFAQKYSEENIMSKDVARLLKKCNYKIIHYWPLYVYREIEFWTNMHPQALVMADVHFPNPRVVIEEMMPVYERYGLNFSETVWPRHLSHTKKILDGAPSFMVPSEYVAETYKEEYPDKAFHIVTYGISVSPYYKKQSRRNVRSFVFAGGTISLEKGCDLLCDYFSKNAEISLHLFGGCAVGQEHIFKKFQQFPNIYFHGHIPKADLQKRIVEFDAGIHLSRFDAYSLSVGEIIGCGLPVIVSDKTGIAAEVKRFGWGVVTPLNEDCVNNAIERLCDPDNYSQYTDNIDSYIRDKHESYGLKMINFYKEHCQ